MLSVLRQWAVLLLFLVPIVSGAAETRDAQRFFNLNMGDLKAELAEARSDGKKALLVMFEQEGCPACRYMRAQILNRVEVQEFYRAHFATLALDIWSSVPLKDFANREQTEKDFALNAKVKGTPTFVFYDLSGNEITRLFGAVATPEEFLLLGQFVVSGAYKTRTFVQYKLEKPARR